ncbi:ribosome-associated GTPase [unidentified eubacterium SCB49]|nr:ribosome-associated GTPase [unidentified eubacterium SCB49]
MVFCFLFVVSFASFKNLNNLIMKKIILIAFSASIFASKV